MKQKSNLKSKIFIVAGFIIVATLISFTKTTYAYLNDDGTSGVNSFASLMLDLVLESDSEDFSISEDLLPNVVSERNITVKNEGTIPFIYSLEGANYSDDTAFCQVLNLKVIYITDSEETTKYEGLLKDFVYEETSALEPGGSASYIFQLTIPNDADSTFSDNTCGFDIDAKAWMQQYLFQQAYWDEEVLTNTIESADWLIEMGFETAETLLDGEETDHPLGYCPVTTIDHSQENEEALQIVKWDAVENTAEYKLTPYTQNGSNWDVGTPILIHDGDDGFSVSDNVAQYETSVPEGVYAYLIEAFDSEGNLIGATTPRLTGFTCTFTVLRVPSGGIVINEIMWGGSSEHELDEWIELRNTTDDDIDVTGWKISASGPSFHEIELNGTIPANGFYLITHFPPNHDQNNEKAAINDSITADVVDDKLHLSDNGEQLILKDVLNNEIDKTPAVGNGQDKGWAEGEEGSNSGEGKWRTMERDDDPGDGTNPDNWHTCIDDRCNDTNFWDDEGDDYGTPKAANYSDEDPEGEEDEGQNVEGDAPEILNTIIVNDIPPVVIPETEEPQEPQEPVEPPAEPENQAPPEGEVSEI